MANRTKVGVIGTGTISSIYLEAPPKFGNFDIVACSDIDMVRAQAQADKYGIPRVYSVNDMLADPDVEVVLNLTIPAAHAEVDLAVLEAGKSVYSEKPLGITRDEGRAVVEAARKTKQRVGCAPDTFLGGGLQTCRKLIDDGWIGTPVAVQANLVTHGPEGWHPNPEFYYAPGAGPLFDMGPYYITALVSLLGPIRRVSGSARISFAERTITAPAKYGQKIAVTTPTHVAAILDFANGAICTFTISFDAWQDYLPFIELYGSEGTLKVPDPNSFGGAVLLRRAKHPEWRDMGYSHAFNENSRGIGLADMVAGMQAGKPHRASGELAYHVLDVMQAIYDSSEQGRHIVVESTCEQPAPLPASYPTAPFNAGY